MPDYGRASLMQAYKFQVGVWERDISRFQEWVVQLIVNALTVQWP